MDGPSKGLLPEKRDGTILVEPTHAVLTKDTEFLGKMDPYVVVSLSNR